MAIIGLDDFRGQLAATDDGFIRCDGMICYYNRVTGQMEPTGRKWCSDDPDVPTIVRREEE